MAATFVLDTDVCIDLIRGRVPAEGMESGRVSLAAFDAAAARHYGEIRAHLEKKGNIIGPLDLLIAAHARSRDANLVTANVQEFRRVPDLKCILWERSPRVGRRGR